MIIKLKILVQCLLNILLHYVYYQALQRNMFTSAATVINKRWWHLLILLRPKITLITTILRIKIYESPLGNQSEMFERLEGKCGGDGGECSNPRNSHRSDSAASLWLQVAKKAQGASCEKCWPQPLFHNPKLWINCVFSAFIYRHIDFFNDNFLTSQHTSDYMAKRNEGDSCLENENEKWINSIRKKSLHNFHIKKDKMFKGWNVKF